jgi:hypothetical protein
LKPASASNDVYLSLLATRAITGLAQLAKDPSRWDAKVQEDLKKGITFCESIETETEDVGGKQNDQLKILRKLTANLGPVNRILYVSPIAVPPKSLNYFQSLTIIQPAVPKYSPQGGLYKLETYPHKLEALFSEGQTNFDNYSQYLTHLDDLILKSLQLSSVHTTLLSAGKGL